MQIIDAAEMFRDYDIPIVADPDTHGITQGQFLYVLEPGGNRIRVVRRARLPALQLDLETKTWLMMSDIDGGLAVDGAKHPWETYFTYGTPNPLSLEEHQREFSIFGAAAQAAEQEIPDPVDESRAVANAPIEERI